jgi:hypothetical protein
MELTTTSDRSAAHRVPRVLMRAVSWRRAALCVSLGLLLLTLAGPAVYAQTTTSGTLRGVIKDQNGDIVPDAKITLTNQKTGAVRETEATSEGVYVFAQVEPDVYTVTVEAANFKKAQITDLVISPATTRGQDVSLEVGGSSEVVNVTAQEEVITETGEKSHTITATQIQNLSLIGRSSLELLRVLPGVVAPEGTALQSVSFGGGSNANNQYAVNGLRGENNNVSIDGSRVIDIGSNNGTIITANNDFVQEVKVQVSNYAAEYGNSAVQISAVTKSGGREFHGSGYYYTRPWQVAANDRSRTSANPPLEIPHDRYNYIGGTIGGPIVFPKWDFNKDRDKAFFFVGFEVQRQFVTSDTRLSRVPTLKQRQGDFSEFLGRSSPLYGQSGDVKIPGGYDGAGTVIPNGDLSPYIDPIGQALINLYPAPNGDFGGGLFNFATAAPSNTNRTDWKMRFDYRFNDKTSLFVRWARESESLNFPYGIWWAASNIDLPSPIEGNNLGRSLSVSVTSIISPTTVNEVVFSGSRLKLDNDYEDPSKVSRSALGLEGFTLPYGVSSDEAPLYIASWGQGLGNLWSPGGLPIFAYNDSFSITDNLSKLAGSHNLKFGGLIEQANKKQNFNTNAPGQIVLGAPWGAGSTGYDFGDLLTGRPAQLGNATSSRVGVFRFYNYEGYAQDSWKVKPNFTLEYGIRVSDFPNNFERNKIGLLFDPAAYVQGAGPFIDGDPTRPNGILQEQLGELPKGVNDDAGVKFAPRFGFAWDIFGNANTVIRGGAGVFYNRVQGNYQYGIINQTPNSFSLTADAGAYPGLTYSNFGTLVDPLNFIGGFDFNTQNPNGEVIPRIVTTSFTIAQRLPYDSVLEVSYVGTQGRHLAQSVESNEILPGTIHGTINGLNADDPVQRAALNVDAVVRQFRPFSALNSIEIQDWSGTSSYHSLQATLSRQQGQHVQYYFTYTFSKALGILATNETGTDVTSIRTRQRQYGILPYDRTHVFNATYILELPDGARGKFDNMLTRGALNGWKVSGISTISSGIPINFQIVGDFPTDATNLGYFGTPNGLFAINYLKDPRLDGTAIGERLFDGRALAVPGFGEEGTYQSPYYLRGPTRYNTDLTLFKTFGVTEHQNLEFRVGFFNIFNQAYARPNNGDPASSDIIQQISTQCLRRVDNVPNGAGGTASVCDPTAGYIITNADSIGRIINKHGHRIIEFAVKYNF